MIQPGSKFAHYEIVSALGKGGMGEVWRARDTKLGREVAIKTLPDEFAGDADRVARFQREATVLASLNHPNIAAIYGLEEHDGNRFLVLELVEGDTLAGRLGRERIPAEEALRIALQIAGALEAAHEKGVVHRDLKPANIKISPDGRVKVLDFGLAKALLGEAADINLSNSPTLSMQATQAGVILGTAAYMSPEQASGEIADHRADVWAFGVVLFEMLAHRQLFTGKTASHVMGAVLNIEPDWNLLPRNLHPRIRWLLERVLEKEAKDRPSGLSDARSEIQKVLADPAGVLPQAAPPAEGTPVAKLQWVAAMVVVAVVSAVVGWFVKPDRAEPSRVTRFGYELPDGVDFRNTGRNVVAVSPDGRYFAYNGTGGIYLRSFDQLEARMIPGTEGDVTNVVFSPDSQWIAFWNRDGRIEKIAIRGGTPVLVTEAEANPLHISWAEDDTLLFSQPAGILRVSANGGTADLVVPNDGDESLADPQLLPDGRGILFLSAPSGSWDQGKIVVQPLDPPGEPKVVWNGSDARYVATGHLTYALNDDLFAIAFDLDALEVRGSAVSLEQGLMRATQSSSANYGVSDNGSLVYRLGASVNLERTLVWVDREGREEPLGVPPRAYAYARLSPDETRIALDIREEDNDIWMWDVARETLERLTFESGLNRGPVWTPDGTRVAFSSQRDGEENVYWQAQDGSGVAEPLTTGVVLIPWGFSPDGRQLLMGPPEPPRDITVVDVETGEITALLTSPEYNEESGEISPDGKWLAYESNESGQFEVYVRPFPEVQTRRIQISTDGGQRPAWSRDGTELFYWRPAQGVGTVMAVPVESGDVFRTLGRPEVVVEGPYLSPYRGRNYEVSGDGERFLMIRAADPPPDAAPEELPRPRIIVVENWFEELKQRVPVP